MPIQHIQTLPIGNALRVFLSPPLTARGWRLLRKNHDQFSGHDDTAALLIHSGSEQIILDSHGLQNGVEVFYALFWTTSGIEWWMDGVSAATPIASFEAGGTDPYSLLRDRLALGLEVLVARGDLTPRAGSIDVLTAPPLLEAANWPVVTVHCMQDTSGERFLGEVISPQRFNVEMQEWDQFDGWYSRVQFNCIAWSLNPDERKALRLALKHIVIANLPVFEAAGMQNIDVTQTDVDDFASFDAPIYQVVMTLTCMAPSFVVSRFDPIRAVATSVKANRE